MKKFFVLFVFLFCLPAFAGEWGVQWHVLSNHFSDRAYEDWNEGTDGFGLRYKFNDTWAIQGGHYRNEFTIRGYNFFANYLGADYTPVKWKWLSAGVYGWAVSGYNQYELAPNPGNMSHPSRVVWEKDGGILPAYGLVMRAEYKQLSYTVRIHPDLPGGVPAAIMSEIGWSFK